MNELGYIKGVLLRIGGGMGHYLEIAQVDIYGRSWCVLVMIMNE